MTTTPGDVRALLAPARAVLLDVDGPICDVFAGRPAPLVADALVRALRDRGVDLPRQVVAEPDPLAILRWTADLGDHDLTRATDDVLVGEEFAAVSSAALTDGAVAAVRTLHAAGVRLAAVSNNSAPAVQAFLAQHGLDGCFAAVVGREHGDPSRMKPSPAPLLRALEALATPASLAVMVGDSLSDLLAARAAGVPCVLLANKPGKITPFQDANPDALITSMRTLHR